MQHDKIVYIKKITGEIIVTVLCRIQTPDLDIPDTVTNALARKGFEWESPHLLEVCSVNKK